MPRSHFPQSFYLEGNQFNSYDRLAFDLKKAILNGGRGPGLYPGVYFRREGSSLDLLRIRKEFGMKAALTRVSFFVSIAPSANGRAQDGDRQKKKGFYALVNKEKSDEKTS